MLARVVSTLSEIGSETVGAPDYDAELVNLRDQMSEAKPEDLPAIVEQMTRVAAIAQRYGKGRDLPVDPQRPYFGHLQLEENRAKRDVLIGKRGFIDRGRSIQIVDWRNAPVSRIYYRYQEGDDYEEQFGERVREGTVSVRRTVSIDDSQLRRVGCPQGTFFVDNDGSWYESDPGSGRELSGGQGKALRPPTLKRGSKHSALGRHHHPGLRADKHLPEIAALIDPLQFELITQPNSGLVVLQGGAGTGKTTVALHRVAYLNFAAPNRFRPDRLLIVVPSLAMVRYVEGVLPALGVSGVRAITARRWFTDMRRRLIPDLPQQYNESTPPAISSLKKHPVLLRALRDDYAARRQQFSTELNGGLGQQPAGDRVQRQWESLRSLPFVAACRKLRTWLADQDLPAVTQQSADSLTQRWIRQARDIAGTWAELMTNAAQLRQHFDGHGVTLGQRELSRFTQWCAQQYDRIQALRDAQEAGEKPPPTDDDENVRGMDYEDDALLLYLYSLNFGAIRPGRKASEHYEHLVVDEAQDLSAAEIKLLVETTGKSQSVTIAGDTQQRLVFDNHFDTWEELLAEIGVDAATNATLRLGYRSTGEVMSLARGLLGELATPADTTALRSGAPVELHRFGDQGEAVAMLADVLRSLAGREPLASVALIARYPSQAAKYAEALRRSEVAAVRLIRDQDFSFKPGIEITDVTQVKGLEFDYVVILDATTANYPESAESRHLLHIAATRAAHQLWLTAAGTPSAVLPSTL